MASPSALVTDLYELTMVAAYVADGLAEAPATFSLFVRDLPPKVGYLVAAGLPAVVDAVTGWGFTDADLDALAESGAVPAPALDHLAGLRFSGTVRAVPEGRLVFGSEPLLEIDAPLAVGQILETVLLNLVTTATGLATNAARHVHAAAGRPVVDFALRRAPGLDTADALVRAGAVVGLAGTSNVAGGLAHGVPLVGTMAHSYVQAHLDELDAFRSYARTHGGATVLLVDTYDTPTGVDRAIEVAAEMRAGGTELHAVRLDSGDLAGLARDARRRLDAAGFPEVEVLVSGGLDEHRIAELVESGAPIDGFGVGSGLGASSEVPVLDTVYKLVELDGRPVRKTSPGKETWPGAKQVFRGAAGDVLALRHEDPPAGTEPLLVPVVVDGAPHLTADLGLAAARARHQADRAALPAAVADLRRPQRWPVEPSPRLRGLTESMP